jgi:hypothetical protein
MKFAHIAAKMYQLVSVSQIALHIAISVDTAVVNTTLKRSVGVKRNQKLG